MSSDAPTPADHGLDALIRWRDDVVASTMFLTRLPVGWLAPTEPAPLSRSMRAFPLVGIIVGLIGWAAFALAGALGLPATLAALLAVLATVLVTGALHEDGLADTADGFGGGGNAERKLAIMRDSRSGAFGVLALIFSVALRSAAIAVLAATAGPALVAAHAVSRATLPVLMRRLDPARSDGLGAGAGQPDDAAVLWCLAIAIIVALVALGFARGVLALVIVAALLGLFAALARRQIGGYTGDVLGAAQQIGEIVMLLSAAA
jgi:adenosylcobinamide-GDP ribazoletransferase